MKKLHAAVLFAALCLVSLCGCQFVKDYLGIEDPVKTRNDYKWNSVATIEELYAMESGKCYRLQADIDLQGRPWTPLIVVGFDGNGHTVSNGTVMETVTEGQTDYYGLESYLGFIGKCNWLDNITVENFRIVYSASERPRIGFAVGQAREVVNVTVKNCTATATSALCFGGVVGSYADVYSCTALDLTVTVKGAVGVGGIIGYWGSAQNSRAMDFLLQTV